VRGPFTPIPTNVAGIRISEIFPRMAKHADKFALLRSVHCPGVAIHDAGHQVMQTGRLFRPGLAYPHVASVLGFATGSNGGVPPHVVLPGPIGNTGGNMPHGQTAGFLGAAHDPFVLHAAAYPDAQAPDTGPPDRVGAIEADRRRNLRDLVDGLVTRFENGPDARLLGSSFDRAYARISSSSVRQAFDLGQEPEAVKDRYGRNRFGLSCLLARRLIEAGVRFVTVNMFETVFHEITWDIHGSAPFSSIGAYKDLLGPMYDHAYASLLEDLDARGLLASTMVVSMGEFGRTPTINPAGGRDHWPQCWTVAMAGGGIRGGQVIGASDEIAAYPRDRPIPAAAIAATVLHGLGVKLDTKLPGPEGRPIRAVEDGVEPIRELF
jgi:hypothetical protein